MNTKGSIGYRSGCKVGWLTFATREEAEVCAQQARVEAEMDARAGYDFGFCVPGSIEQLKDGTFEVCVP